MSATEETLTLLRLIDASLKLLVAQKRAEAPKVIASDRVLDSQYGDPPVKFDPRDWTGGSFKGRRMSECPAPFLELLAETFDYFARKAEDTNEQHKGKPVAEYKRMDAAKARGWAKRVRDGRAAGDGAGMPSKPAGWAAGDESDASEESGWQ